MKGKNPGAGIREPEGRLNSVATSPQQPAAGMFLHSSFLVLPCLLVIGVYAWSAKPGRLELSSPNAGSHYYNLLVQGFHAGQLHLKREVPSELRTGNSELGKRESAVRVPGSSMKSGSLSWAERTQLLDLSYYRGKLYFYFEVIPVLVLFWPYAALTGHYLPHQAAVVLLFSMGYLFSVGVIWRVWQRYLSEVGVWGVGAGTLALGVAYLALPCLPRSGVYEVAIGCGYAGTVATLLLLWQALQATHGRAWWLAAASLTFGLALGARPSWLFGAVILLVPVVWERQKAEGRRQNSSFSILPSSFTVLLAAVGPITVVGIGLLVYNYQRFGDVLEFGHQYALSWVNEQWTQSQAGVVPFSLRYLGCNGWAYGFAPAIWGGVFPFVGDIATRPLPGGHVGMERVFGALPNLPWLWLGLAAPLWAKLGTRNSERGKGTSAIRDPRSALSWFGVVLVLLSSISALTLGLFFAACLRYQAEFLTGATLMAVLGLLSLERTLKQRQKAEGRMKKHSGLFHSSFILLASLLLAFSVTFNVLVTVRLASDHHAFRGAMSLRTGGLAEAVAHYQKALTLQADNVEAHTGLGTALFRLGKVAEALKHSEEATRLKPDFAEAHDNLGTILFETGRVTEAITRLEQALRLKPNDAGIRFNLGVVLFQQGKATEAIGHLLQTVRLKPDHAEARNILGAALFQLGTGNSELGKANSTFRDQRSPLEAAVEHLAQAVRLKPDYEAAHFNLGTVLQRQGRMPEAVAHYRKVLELNPHVTLALNSLAWILATETNAAIRSVAEAIRHAERACELTTNSAASCLDTLGAAYSEAGRFSEAVQAAERAAALASAAGDQALAARVAYRLKWYRDNRPYHEMRER